MNTAHTPKLCKLCGNTHSPGAREVARVVCGGRADILTEFGRKTACGLADLIDRETAAERDRLRAINLDLQLALARLVDKIGTLELPAAINYACAAIARAKGEA